ncbi:MAG: GNAT family N-acetyltransferase [Aliivibrio sp.]|uniref:GNAT family N-acetyltransferase n=1 Tax=Aliivibrio sp. TaxID=1872443 RepID=UPI001A434EA5|nr:GNAT family N-acetyltransferase [Aliivibrio sp.]
MLALNIVIFKDEKPQIQSIRNTVFTIEQGVDSTIDFDGQDDDAIHVLVKENGRAVGTGRMLADGHIGRVAIIKESRGEGVGAKVVLRLVDEAIKLNFASVYLGAQLQAVDFYLKLGFTPYGEEYIEADIKHISMEKVL